MLQRLSGQELVDATDRTTIDPERPFLVGVGPAEFSTSVAIEPWPSIIWDTNLFYRDMGVHPKVDRKRIKQAYLNNRGHEDKRLTMIASVLLSPLRRLTYDLVPLGSLFFDDEIEEAVRRAAAAEASGVRAGGDEVDEQALNDKIDQMRITPPGEMDELPEREDRYQWSYYLYKSGHDDTEKLSLWRSEIIRVLHESGVDKPPRLGIGYMSSNDPSEKIRVLQIGFRVVILIDEQASIEVDHLSDIVSSFSQ